MEALGGLTGGSALTELAGGLIAGIGSGAGFDQVAGLVAKNLLLSALPLYALGQPLALATEAIAQAIQGEPNLPVIGWLLAPGATLSGAKAVQTKVRDAALYVAGWDPWLQRTPGGGLLLLPPVSGPTVDELTGWLGDLNRDLNAALRQDGEAGVEQLLATNARALRELHLAVALHDWTLAAGWPLHGYRQAVPQGYPLNVGVPAGAKLPAPLAVKQLSKRFPLYKALGIAPYSVYAQALSPNLELPGAAAPAAPAAAQGLEDGGAGQVEPVDVGASLGAGLQQLGQALGGIFGTSSSAGLANAAAEGDAAAGLEPEARSSSLLLLALVGLALAAWLVATAK